MRRTHSAFLMYSKLLVTLTMKIIIKGSSQGNGNWQKNAGQAPSSYT